MSGEYVMWRNPLNHTNRIFEELDREFSDAEQMLDRMFRTVKQPMKNLETFPYYYGYQITVGPDGKPRIREFGNAIPGSSGLMQQSAVRQPLVDTSYEEKDNSLTITAEMPGMYQANDYDLAGFCVGVLDKAKIINNEKLQIGDTLMPLAPNKRYSMKIVLL